MCKRIVSNYLKKNSFFINKQGKQRKMVKKKLNIHCYSNQVKKQFYPMNGVRVLTVESSGSVDRVRRSFVSDGSLSKRSSELLSLIYL